MTTITKFKNGEVKHFEVKLTIERIGNITICSKKSIPLEGGEDGRRNVTGFVRREFSKR